MLTTHCNFWRNNLEEQSEYATCAIFADKLTREVHQVSITDHRAKAGYTDRGVAHFIGKSQQYLTRKGR